MLDADRFASFLSYKLILLRDKQWKARQEKPRLISKTVAVLLMDYAVLLATKVKMKTPWWYVFILSSLRYILFVILDLSFVYNCDHEEWKEWMDSRVPRALKLSL